MDTIEGNQLLARLNWRYATKQFDPTRKISPENWAALENALILSPSSYGLQPWRFIVISDQKMREKLFSRHGDSGRFSIARTSLFLPCAR